MRITFYILLPLLAFGAGFVVVRQMTLAPSLVSINGPTMGGTWSLQLRAMPSGISRDELARSIQAILDRIELQASTWKPDSDLSRFNQSASTDWIAVPSDIVKLVIESQRISELSGGAYDVTVLPLVNAWGFGPERAGLRVDQVPSDSLLAEIRSHVGFAKLHARESPPAMKKDEARVQVDLSAIAKGFAADEVATYLDSIQARDYLIDIGGELKARGRPWRIGIDAPTPGSREIQAKIELVDRAIATSGDYRNFAEKDGRRYCHEIDPATGRPIEHNLASVSVIDSSGATADALATALLVLGPEKGPELARKMNVPAMFIVREKAGFRTITTPGFPAVNP